VIVVVVIRNSCFNQDESYGYILLQELIRTDFEISSRNSSEKFINQLLINSSSSDLLPDYSPTHTHLRKRNVSRGRERKTFVKISFLYKGTSLPILYMNRGKSLKQEIGKA
jgi:hypothetical protein